MDLMSRTTSHALIVPLRTQRNLPQLGVKAALNNAANPKGRTCSKMERNLAGSRGGTIGPTALRHVESGPRHALDLWLTLASPLRAVHLSRACACVTLLSALGCRTRAVSRVCTPETGPLAPHYVARARNTAGGAWPELVILRLDTNKNSLG